MRPPQKNRNNRNKNNRNNNKPQGNVQNRVFESAGPEGKVRGTPQQIIEKYLILARDAQTSGDRVMSENFLQHAEHYIRLLSAAQAQNEERNRQMNGGARQGDYDDSQYDGDEDEGDGLGDRAAPMERREPVEARRDDQQSRERADEQPRADAGAGRDNDEAPRRDRDDASRREGGEGGRRRRGERRDQPRAEDPRGDQPAAAAAEQERAPAVPEALQTIDADDGDDRGPVATPESAASAEPKKEAPRRRRRKPVAEAAEGGADATEAAPASEAAAE